MQPFKSLTTRRHQHLQNQACLSASSKSSNPQILKNSTWSPPSYQDSDGGSSHLHLKSTALVPTISRRFGDSEGTPAFSGKPRLEDQPSVQPIVIPPGSWLVHSLPTLFFRCDSILISPQLVEVIRHCAKGSICSGIEGEEPLRIRYVPDVSCSRWFKVAKASLSGKPEG